MGQEGVKWLPWRVLHSNRFDCGSTGLWVLQMGTVGYCGYCAVPTVPVGTAGYCGYCGYCKGDSDSWVLRQYPWVLQGTVGTVGTARTQSDSWVLWQYLLVLQGTVGTVGTVTVGYCGYCRCVLQGTAERIGIECSGRECYTHHSNEFK